MKVAYQMGFLAFAVLVFTSSSGCNCRRDVPDAFNRLAQTSLQRTNPVVSFERVTSFEWDSVFIFRPYTTVANIKQQIGYDWGAAKDTGIDMSDSFHLVVFVENGKVVKHLQFNRSLGDFHDLKSGNMFRRGADKFRVQRASPGTSEIRLNYYPLREQGSTAQTVGRPDLAEAERGQERGQS